MQKRTERRTKGTLFVISAPSGAGKTTLCKRLLNKKSDLRLSVSYTTRSPRKGETNNVDYTFITKSRFMKMVEKGAFAEWASVHGNLYGTSVRRMEELNRDGYDILLDIDIHGAMQLKKSCKNAVFIFILPPSIDTLQDRLVKRGTDSKEVIAQRLDNAKAEIAYYKDYDYIIVNDSIDRAYRELESIITSSRLLMSKVNPKWIKKVYNV